MSDPFLMSAYLPLSDSCSICKQEGVHKDPLWGRVMCESCYQHFVGKVGS
jgi:hypothetical protein